MPRQSFSLTEPNDEWLSAMVESKEYSNKTEVLNDIIRRERERQGEVEYLRAKLIRAEQGGMSERTPEQIRAETKAKLKKDASS
jgi:antitoxin ParD1/3/4